MPRGEEGEDTSAENDAPAGPPPTPTRSPAPTEPTGSATRSTSAGKIRYGPVDCEADLTGGGQDVELDGTAPVLAGTLPKGEDLGVGATTGAPALSSSGGATDFNLAPLPASGPTPTEAECAEAVERSGTYSGEATRGARFWLTTTEGRTACLRVVSAPSGADTAKFQVTVWETSDA